MTQSEVLAEKLWRATRRGDAGKVQTLLGQGANPNEELYWTKQWSKGFKLPPLHTACKNGNLEALKILHESGAKADIKDTTGQTPLERALDNRYDSESYIEVANYLMKHGYSSSKERDLLLLGACRWGKLDVVKELIEKHKVDPTSVEDHKGWSPLGRALYNLHTFEGRLDVGLYLINFGCGNDNDKAKLLFGACQWGRLDVVKELVEQHKLDPAVLADEDGMTPVDIATSGECTDVVEYLTSLPKESQQPDVTRPAVPRLINFHTRKKKTLDSEAKNSPKEIKEDIEPAAIDTPLSKEDVDALNKLLKDTKIELASNLLTLEMVQQLLHEKGLKTLSKNLRAKLNKVIKQDRLNKKLEDLKSNKDLVDVLFLNIFLVGPTGVGKTATLNHLLKCFECSLPSEHEEGMVLGQSTDVPSNDLSLTPQTSSLTEAECFPSAKKPDKCQYTRVERQALAYQQNRLKIIKARLRKLLATGDYSKTMNLLGKTSLNFIEISGEVNFSEMLPALSTGPAIYLVLFSLNKELDMLPPSQSDVPPISNSVQTVVANISEIFAAISSVHCVTNELALIPTTCSEYDNPIAILVGTHKDKLKDPQKKIEQINEGLKTIMEKFSSILVSPTDLNTCFFPIENQIGSDIRPVGEFINEISNIHFKNAFLRIPPQWLVLGAVLSKEFKLVTIDDCLELGELLEMNKEEVMLCLHYLHSKGTLMYYDDIPDDEDDWFKNHIISSPQVVFDSINQLIISPLQQIETQSEHKITTFSEMRQFSVKSLKNISLHNEREELIPFTHLVRLLYHVNLLSPISHTNSDGADKVSDFMPALLECATSDELPSSNAPDANNPEPLLITFSCGYVPTGTFCGLINRLVSLGPQEILGLTWELVEKNLKRNCISFYVDYANKVTLISHDTCYEIRVKRKTPIPLHDLCTHVLSVIIYILNSLYTNLVPQIAFDCPCPKHVSQKDLCTLFESKTHFWFTCKRSPVTLRKHQQVWLGKHVTLDSSAKLEVLKFAEDNFSFHWTKEGSKQQITTQSELTFQDVSDDDLGYYRCEVKEAGKVILTLYRALYIQTESPVPDEEVAPDRTVHLKTLRKTLWDVRAKWEDLGIDLGLTMGTIKVETAATGQSPSIYTSTSLTEFKQGHAELLLANTTLQFLLKKF